jgi:hypothetical protein
MRVLVTGSRDCRDGELALTTLQVLAADARSRGDRGPHYLHHGGASGADELFADAARSLGWTVRDHPADWEGPCRSTCRHGRRRRRGGVPYCQAAGGYRNQDMVDLMVQLRADQVVGMVKDGAANRGTRDCLERAHAAGLAVTEVCEPAVLDDEPGLEPAASQAGQPAAPMPAT